MRKVTGEDLAVRLSRLAGAVIVILGLALADHASQDGWQALYVALQPVSLGVLVFVAAEILSRLRRSDE